MADKKNIYCACMHYLKPPGFTGIIHIVSHISHNILFVFCFSFPIIIILIVIVCFSNIDMSQAEQVPEDMPAYLNDEPVGTGKLLASNIDCFLYSQSSSSGHVAGLYCVN